MFTFFKEPPVLVNIKRKFINVYNVIIIDHNNVYKNKRMLPMLTYTNFENVATNTAKNKYYLMQANGTPCTLFSTGYAKFRKTTKIMNPIKAIIVVC